jgi:hypothetical protein
MRDRPLDDVRSLKKTDAADSEAARALTVLRRIADALEKKIPVTDPD